MNAAFRLPKDRVNALEPAAVEAHVLAHGWEADPRASSAEVGVYHHPNDPEAEIFLPRDKGFLDFALRMSEVLQTLAVAEQRKAWELLDELSTGQLGPAPNASVAGQHGASISASATRTKQSGS